MFNDCILWVSTHTLYQEVSKNSKIIEVTMRRGFVNVALLWLLALLPAVAGYVGVFDDVVVRTSGVEIDGEKAMLDDVLQAYFDDSVDGEEYKKKASLILQSIFENAVKAGLSRFAEGVQDYVQKNAFSITTDEGDEEPYDFTSAGGQELLTALNAINVDKLIEWQDEKKAFAEKRLHDQGVDGLCEQASKEQNVEKRNLIFDQIYQQVSSQSDVWQPSTCVRYVKHVYGEEYTENIEQYFLEKLLGNDFVNLCSTDLDQVRARIEKVKDLLIPSPAELFFSFEKTSFATPETTDLVFTLLDIAQASGKFLEKAKKVWLIDGDRKIFQLQSLDQTKDLVDVLPNAGVACGYCTVYNASYFYKYLKEKDDAYFQSNTLVSSKAEFLEWEKEAKKLIIANNLESLKRRLRGKDSASEGYKKVKQGIHEQLPQVVIDDTKINDDDYLEKIAVEMAQSMLFESELILLVKGEGIKEDVAFPEVVSHVSLLGLQEILFRASMFETDLENFILRTDSIKFFEAIKDFREGRQSVHLVFLNPGKLHWIAIAFVRDCMVIMDSLNKDRREDEGIKILYDIFYRLPIEKVHEIVGLFPSAPPVVPSTPLELLKQKLIFLKKRLQDLRDKLGVLSQAIRGLKSKLGILIGGT